MGRYAGRDAAAPGLPIAAGCSCIFAALAVGVLTGGPLVRLDLSTADAPHAHASGAPGLTDSVRVVGSLGSLEALALVSALVAVALLARRSWSALAAWLVAVLGGEALNLLLKGLFARPRSHFEHPLVVEASYGFPSGQAMGSLAVYGMLACFAVLTWTGRGKRGVSVGGAAVLVILIGFARVYLGAHYLGDVVGGFVAGGAWLSAVIAGREKIGGHGMASRRGQASSP